MARYRILSIDGGGIRGLLVAVLLEQLDMRVEGWRDRVDLLAGTSTGGIIALGLAAGLSPERLRMLYYDKSPDIFESLLFEFREGPPLVRARCSNRRLKEELADVFGSTRLQDLKRRVLISSFELDSKKHGHWKPKFFHNYPGDDSDGALLAADVGLHTSAAPTYFPTSGRFIDGGVVANNPAMAALAQTQDHRALDPHPPLENVVMLSIGTGFLPRRIEAENRDWGFAQWAMPLLRIMFDGLSKVPDYQCSQLLNDRYHRLEKTLEHDIELDDYRARDELVYIAETDMKKQLDDAEAWLTAYW